VRDLEDLAVAGGGAAGDGEVDAVAGVLARRRGVGAVVGGDRRDVGLDALAEEVLALEVGDRRDVARPQQGEPDDAEHRDGHHRAEEHAPAGHRSEALVEGAVVVEGVSVTDARVLRIV
jgi:hypothetical protein